MMIHEALLPVGHITQTCPTVVNERLTESRTLHYKVFFTNQETLASRVQKRRKATHRREDSGRWGWVLEGRRPRRCRANLPCHRPASRRSTTAVGRGSRQEREGDVAGGRRKWEGATAAPLPPRRSRRTAAMQGTFHAKFHAEGAAELLPAGREGNEWFRAGIRPRFAPEGGETNDEFSGGVVLIPGRVSPVGWAAFPAGKGPTEQSLMCGARHSSSRHETVETVGWHKGNGKLETMTQSSKLYFSMAQTISLLFFCGTRGIFSNRFIFRNTFIKVYIC
jgi:hypothetical protein